MKYLRIKHLLLCFYPGFNQMDVRWDKKKHYPNDLLFRLYRTGWRVSRDCLKHTWVKCNKCGEWFSKKDGTSDY